MYDFKMLLGKNVFLFAVQFLIFHQIVSAIIKFIICCTVLLVIIQLE